MAHDDGFSASACRGCRGEVPDLQQALRRVMVEELSEVDHGDLAWLAHRVDVELCSAAAFLPGGAYADAEDALESVAYHLLDAQREAQALEALLLALPDDDGFSAQVPRCPDCGEGAGACSCPSVFVGPSCPSCGEGAGDCSCPRLLGEAEDDGSQCSGCCGGLPGCTGCSGEDEALWEDDDV